MNVLEKIAEKAFRAVGGRDIDYRQYAAAKNGRLTSDQRNFNYSANQEIFRDVRQLRANSRALARDNDYIVGYLKKLTANVIGRCGLTLQVNAKKATGDQKESLNARIEDEWKTWSLKTNCDVTGQMSLRDIAALALQTKSIDGEFLIRFVYDNTSQYGLKLQMLDVDWLDEDYNEQARPGQNKITMSIEYDGFDKPVAYWLTDPKWSTTSIPGLKLVPQGIKRLRIPADQIMHRFDRDRVGQGRGVPRTHSNQLTMHQLDGFDEAELVGARVAASNMAFISAPAPVDPASDIKPTIDTEVAPGQILEIPPGYTVHDTNFPKPQDSSFSSRLLRKAGAAFGISYSTFTGDLSDVNFSSIRAGTIEEREIWKIEIEWMAQHFYQDIYEKWLMFNVGRIVPVTALSAVMYPRWRGRGFDWVDPLKDANADIAALNRGLKTMTEILADKGKDFEEEMDQHAAEAKYIEKLGLQFASPDLQTQIAADNAANADGANPKDNKKSKGASGK